MAEAGRRICSTRGQQYSKPGRQLITFLLFANITLWIMDTFMTTHNWITQEIQLRCVLSLKLLDSIRKFI